jgi:phosphoglucosamine mutase
MEVMASTGKELRELRSVMTEMPQVLTNVRVGSKDGWDADAAIAESIAEWERKLGPRGRILVRPSGTEQLIRVMVEAPSPGEAEQVASSIAGVVEARLG